MAPQPFLITYSKMAAYRQCRKRYWYRYISGDPAPEPPPNVPGIVGTAVHTGLRVLGETRDAELGRNEIAIYLRQPDHEIAGPGTEGYGRAMAYYDAGVEVHDSIDSAACWTERDLRHPSRQGIEIFARADRVDRLRSGDWLVIDWKTGADHDEWTDEQLDLVHVAARSTCQIPAGAEVTAVAWNLKQKVQNPAYTPRTRRLDRSAAIHTIRKYSTLAEQLESETEFPATPGSVCSYCEWRPQCPAADTGAVTAWEVEQGSPEP